MKFVHDKSDFNKDDEGSCSKASLTLNPDGTFESSERWDSLMSGERKYSQTKCSGSWAREGHKAVLTIEAYDHSRFPRYQEENDKDAKVGETVTLLMKDIEAGEVNSLFDSHPMKREQ